MDLSPFSSVIWCWRWSLFWRISPPGRSPGDRPSTPLLNPSVFLVSLTQLLTQTRSGCAPSFKFVLYWNFNLKVWLKILIFYFEFNSVHVLRFSIPWVYNTCTCFRNTTCIWGRAYFSCIYYNISLSFPNLTLILTCGLYMYSRCI